MEEMFENFAELVEKKRFHQLLSLLSEMHEINTAHFLDWLPKEKAVLVFRMLKKDMSTDVFPELSPELQEYIITSIPAAEQAFIIEDLYVDEAVDLLEELPATVVKKILKNATPDTRRLINQFLNYPEDSVGSVMTAELVDLKKDMTVADAISHIRTTGVDKATVYSCYVTDEKRILEGTVSFRELIYADREDKIENVMDTDVAFVRTTDDKEKAAMLISEYDMLALPVVDGEKRLVGIVTVDDALDVITDAATEDIEIMAAIHPSEKPYLKTGVLELSKNRILWLLVLMISSMITGGILQNYEAAFAALPLLVSFIPMLTDTGGNCGAQSSTLVIRGMAVSEIRPGDILKVMWKEIRVAFICGAVLSVVNAVRLLIFYPGQELIVLTVCLSLFATVIIAKTVGCVLPIVAKLCRVDPAIMASPLITTIVDALALIIYFSIATVLLGNMIH